MLGGENHSSFIAHPNPATGESMNHLELIRNAASTATGPSTSPRTIIRVVSTSHSVSIYRVCFVFMAYK